MLWRGYAMPISDIVLELEIPKKKTQEASNPAEENN